MKLAPEIYKFEKLVIKGGETSFSLSYSGGSRNRDKSTVQGSTTLTLLLFSYTLHAKS